MARERIPDAVWPASSSARESLRGIEDVLREAEAPKVEARKQNDRQETKIDRRPFAERSLEELRDRARELEIEGRSAMSKDELIAALRQHAK